MNLDFQTGSLENRIHECTAPIITVKAINSISIIRCAAQDAAVQAAPPASTGAKGSHS